MKVLVCGGRKFWQREKVFKALDDLKPTIVIHGNCKTGADALAEEWANSRGVDVHKFNANWDLYGRAAGPIRNRAMLSQGEPDIVVAFPGGKGTADMVRRAREAGVPVVHHR